MTGQAVQINRCGQVGLPDLLAEETERATAELMRRLLDEIPLYRTLDSVQLADVTETVRAGWTSSLKLWAAGRLATPEELRRFRANGATRAAEGRPLPVVLRAYRVSGMAIYDYVVTHPSARLSTEEERNFARLMMTFVDQLSNEVTIGYVETTGQLASQQGRARREFLEDLLAGRLLAATEVTERAATLGLQLPTRPSLVVAAPTLGDGSLLADQARRVLQEIARVSPASPRMQLITRGQLVLIIDRGADQATLKRSLSSAGLTGVIIEVADLTELAAGYHRARRVHELLVSTRIPTRGTVDNDETVVLALIARMRDEALTEEVVEAILGELSRPMNAVLLETLDAYFGTGNAVSAAHRLNVHAQTMRSRLRRIREMTGRDPAHGWDRFLLEFALRLSPRPADADRP
jgi:PucR C-terminal helix-turn-helix domain